MLAPGDRVLVAVAGARIRSRSGTSCSSSATRRTGCTSGSVSGSTAMMRRTSAGSRMSAAEAADCSRCETEYGYDIPVAREGDPTGAVLGVRPLEAAPLRFRHERGRLRRMATGHNLDDEAAVLFGNSLQWRHRIPRPASSPSCRGARLPPQGQAARPAHRKRNGRLVRRPRASTIGRGVPDGHRQPSPRVQGGVQSAGADSPGTRRRSTSSSSTHGAAARNADAPPRSEALGLSARCGAPTTGEVCAFCRLVDRVGPRSGARRAASPASGAGGEPNIRTTARWCFCSTSQAASLPGHARGGQEFHSHYGFVPHAEIIGQPEG